MILRRFMQHVREQNWFAVSLDVIVVIVGIFLGLQVQNWYEEQGERALEEEYLMRIEGELLQSIELNESVFNVGKSALDNLSAIMKSIETCEIAAGDEDSIATGLYRLSNTLPASYLRSVIDELNTTGNFKIIQNVALRDAFAGYMQFFSTGLDVTNQMRDRINPHVTFVEKQLVYRLKDGNTTYRNFSRDEIIFNFEEFCSTEGNLEAISAIRTFRQVNTSRAEDAIRRQSELRDMVRLELERFK